jgi:arginyl-tRNA synthetase
MTAGKIKIKETVSQFRLKLTAATAQVLANGLYLLGIETLEQM